MMTHQLDTKELGRRLRVARESVGQTQAIAARNVGLSRTTLVAIEKGERAIRDDELIALVDVYGIRLNELLRREAINVDLLPRFRKMTEPGEGETETAISILNDFVAAEVELESILGVERRSSLPQERPLLPGDVRKQAERDAAELRERLGLGQGPVRNAFALLELDMGIRLYAHPLPANVSGLFAFDEKVGACVLLNSSHRYERQVQTAIHELGHIVSARHRPDVCDERFQVNSREERYAITFAPAFLMPANTVLRKLNEIRGTSKQLTRRHVIILSHYFGASREGFVRRLEEIKLAPKGAWDWFVRNGGITDKQAEEVLGTDTIRELSSRERLTPSSVRLETLAAQALRRELMSEGQISGLLKIDRLKARRLALEAEDIQGVGNFIAH